MKRYLKMLLAALVLAVLPLSDLQGAERFNLPSETVFDANGDPLSGAEEPKVSAPSTAAGKRRRRSRTNHSVAELFRT